MIKLGAEVRLRDAGFHLLPESTEDIAIGTLVAYYSPTESL